MRFPRLRKWRSICPVELCKSVVAAVSFIFMYIRLQRLSGLVEEQTADFPDIIFFHTIDAYRVEVGFFVVPLIGHTVLLR